MAVYAVWTRTASRAYYPSSNLLVWCMGGFHCHIRAVLSKWAVVMNTHASLGPHYSEAPPLVLWTCAHPKYKFGWSLSLYQIDSWCGWDGMLCGVWCEVTHVNTMDNCRHNWLCNAKLATNATTFEVGQLALMMQYLWCNSAVHKKEGMAFWTCLQTQNLSME